VFWRKMYGASMSDDKFNKEYKYNIRHSYGQEGRRANYPPKRCVPGVTEDSLQNLLRLALLIPSCQQILTQNQPGTQDSHGCPFRHFSPENLTTFLTSTYPELDRSSPEMREIMDSVKASHYHVACTRVFEVTHKLKKGEGLGKDGESVSHPNKYADRSREMER
jgi:DNA primase large subunit